MLNICVRCEYRLDCVPLGSAEAIASARYARVSRTCLQVCSESSLEGINGVNFEDRTIDGENQTGTIVISRDGMLNDAQELYKPIRLSLNIIK